MSVLKPLMKSSVKPSLLIVDDDDRLRELLESYLKEQDFSVITADNADKAKQILASDQVDLIVLDITMPGQDGLSLTKELRQQKMHTPILLLTARGNTTDRITGLETGADDYLSKPFEPKELSLRIHAILKRTASQQVMTNSVNLVYKQSGWRFTPSQSRLFIAEDEIILTQSEAKLLQILWENMGNPVSREILTDAFGTDYFSRSLDILVTRLRKKIGDDSKKPTHVRTIRNQGYCLEI